MTKKIPEWFKKKDFDRYKFLPMRVGLIEVELLRYKLKKNLEEYKNIVSQLEIAFKYYNDEINAGIRKKEK